MWMQNEELLDKTASERLTLDQEYEMQKKWFHDEDSMFYFLLLLFVSLSFLHRHYFNLSSILEASCLPFCVYSSNVYFFNRMYIHNPFKNHLELLQT